ncbi:MAG TPA: hypothetical protein DDX19_27380 [Rhodopirellula baltica]|nr:hypothetical protein [Rhodopirellula baltica]
MWNMAYAPINAANHVGQVPPGGVIGCSSLTLREHSNSTTRFVPKHRRGCHVEHGLRAIIAYQKLAQHSSCEPCNSRGTFWPGPSAE